MVYVVIAPVLNFETTPARSNKLELTMVWNWEFKCLANINSKDLFEGKIFKVKISKY